VSLLIPWGLKHWQARIIEREPQAARHSSARLARVIGLHRQSIDLITEQGLISVQSRTGLHTQGARLAVGDWILLGRDSTQAASIEDVLPRTSILSRRASGPRYEIQELAANLDQVFVLSAMDRTFSAARIERFLVACWLNQIQPVLILTRSDQAASIKPFLRDLTDVLIDTPVIALNALSPAAITTLKPFLRPGQTTTLLGTSGAGKSSLTNTLAGEEVMATQSVRAFDDKGRHTTTRRRLIQLPENRGLLIDSPGVREMQIWHDQVSEQASFKDLHLEAALCKFSDCQHETEYSCAVKNRAEHDQVFDLLLRKYKAVRRVISKH
jgi:ribosome biogenesis GTPase